ncbi:putative glycoside hydrolase family 15 protein [Amycolatopsis magusensis]|uniref:putative glycoside hydrolase family 15 protein n=1 Tax=Amycolatopsis magusensis TaxID=882444 RepID=UPI0024A9B35B|nr:putative glycoside hydrolase family 15 protein [Amycolatopsis magusensis]MDI5982714.1 putative glycoside hydrolase family 15 protein [Amycolatopsis magusensis]
MNEGRTGRRGTLWRAVALLTIGVLFGWAGHDVLDTPDPTPLPAAAPGLPTSPPPSSTTSAPASRAAAPSPEPAPPCAWWYAIGDRPTDAELETAAKRYKVVVLNATETAAMKRLHELNPQLSVFVYKDLSSTRNYPGAVEGDKDAPYLPSGIGYNFAQREHPGWFAVDTSGRRIEWNGYPRHWQMTVWNADYQQAWTKAVTEEVVREGWDGVLADNDFHTLKYYSPAVLSGTANAEETDELLRKGLDELMSVAGESLAKAGKQIVPNVSETHLIPGRWTAHSRFGGAMEENFGFRDDGGSGELLTFQGNEWQELRAQAALGESWLLLITRVKSTREERAGYASAAMLAGPKTCWMPASTQDYTKPEWSELHESGLGLAIETATRQPTGVWAREFTNGWVAVNPTAGTVPITPPAGMARLDGTPVSQVELPAADGVVLTRVKTPPSSSSSAPPSPPSSGGPAKTTPPVPSVTP